MSAATGMLPGHRWTPRGSGACIQRTRPCHRRLLVSVLVSLVLPVAGPASARIDLSPRTPAATLDWDGSDLVHEQDFCVESTQGAQDGAVIDYRVRAESPAELSNGESSIPATLEWQDLQSGQVEVLEPDIFSPDIFSGAEQDCPGGDNARLRITFSSEDLAAAGPGFYDNRFALEVENDGQGRNSRNGWLELELTLEDSLRVSQLDDIDLGSFDGESDLSGEDSLCIFRASGDDYAVTVTGEGDAGAYVMRQGDSEIPFSAQWDDGTGAEELDPGVLLGNRANSFSNNDHCDGGAANNAALQVDVTADDINQNATELGPHVGVLTIMVEMQ